MESELPKRTFNSEQIYTESEIRSVCPGAEFQDKEGGGRYLIAEASDSEYWFLPEGHGWKVDHTWTSLILVPAEQDPDG